MTGTGRIQTHGSVFSGLVFLTTVWPLFVTTLRLPLLSSSKGEETNVLNGQIVC